MRTLFQGDSFLSSPDKTSNILKAITEPITHEKILIGPVDDVSPSNPAIKLKINTIIRKTKKATEILRIRLYFMLTHPLILIAQGWLSYYFILDHLRYFPLPGFPGHPAFPVPFLFSLLFLSKLSLLLPPVYLPMCPQIDLPWCLPGVMPPLIPG